MQGLHGAEPEWKLLNVETPPWCELCESGKAESPVGDTTSEAQDDATDEFSESPDAIRRLAEISLDGFVALWLFLIRNEWKEKKPGAVGGDTRTAFFSGRAVGRGLFIAPANYYQYTYMNIAQLK